MSWLLIILLLLGFGYFTYRVYRRELRRWWKAMVTKRGAAPHERWPEILHWQAGDNFDPSLFKANHTGYKLVALQEDGYAVVDWFGEREWLPISTLVGCNTSLRTRRVNESLKESAEYMELLKQFNIAYKELQERDRKNGIVV